MEWYCVCWPWLTAKRVELHQLSFLFMKHDVYTSMPGMHLDDWHDNDKFALFTLGLRRPKNIRWPRYWAFLWSYLDKCDVNWKSFNFRKVCIIFSPTNLCLDTCLLLLLFCDLILNLKTWDDWSDILPYRDWLWDQRFTSSRLKICLRLDFQQL